MKNEKNSPIGDYEIYKELCESMGLTACDPSGFLVGMGFAQADEIPYITTRNTVWLRNVKKKRNNDRPLALAMHEQI